MMYKALGVLLGITVVGVAILGLWLLWKRTDTGFPPIEQVTELAEPRSEAVRSFGMTIDDVFELKTPGQVVVVGVVNEGRVFAGDSLFVRTASGDLPVVVRGLETFDPALNSFKPLDSASEGERVSILFEGIRKDEIRPNDVLMTEAASK